MHRHGGRLRRLLRHEDERAARQLPALLGFVVREPRRPARQVPPGLHGDGHVGQRMRNTLQRRDRHPERIAGLGELRGDGGGLLDQAHQRGGRQQPPFLQGQIIFRERLGAAAQHGAAVGLRDVDPRHRQPADVVDLGGTGVERQPHHLVAVAQHDVVGDRTGRDQPDGAHGVELRVQPGHLLPADHGRQIGAEGIQQAGRADVVDPRHRRQRPADLLGHQGQVDHRRAVATRAFGQRHGGCAHGAQPFPEALVESRRLGRAHDLDGAGRFEELAVGRLQVGVILGQAVVEPAQFVAVHRHAPSPEPKKNSSALL